MSCFLLPGFEPLTLHNFFLIALSLVIAHQTNLIAIVIGRSLSRLKALAINFAITSKNKKVAIFERWITKWDAIEKSSFHSAQTIILLLLYPNLIF